MALESQAEPGRLARHRDRERPRDVALLEHRRPAEQLPIPSAGKWVVRGVEGHRRDHAEVDQLDRRAGRAGDHHQAATAEAAHPGFEHGECQRGGDCGIDRVAAGFENSGADLGGSPMLRGDHVARRVHRWLAQHPAGYHLL